eukprot:g28690.t1
MEASQVQTDVIHYNSVLSACRSKWQAATYLLQRAARNHLQLQSLSFCLSFSAARAQPSAWQLCLSALHVDMPSLKVEADIRSFGAAIGACERGRWVEAGYLLEEMAQARLPGDVMSFSSGISACGEGAEWEAAMQVLPKMEHLQIVPDCVCINTLIGTYAGCVWPKAIESLRWLTSKRWSEAVSFNAAMKVVGSASFWELVLELMRQMTISAINPTLVSFNTAMAYVSWEVALCLLEDLKTAALKADEISLSQVLSSLSSASEWQKALELVEVIPSTVGYNQVIRACGQVKCWYLALELLHRMPGRSPHQDLVSFNLALTSCRDHPQHAAALLKQLPFPPDAVTFSAAIMATVDWREALCLLEEMSQQSLESTAPRILEACHNAAIRACDRAGEWTKALVLLDEMVLGDFSDIISFNSVINACEQASEWLVALRLLETIEAEGSKVSPDVVTISAAISACEKAGIWMWALGLLERSVEPDTRLRQIILMDADFGASTRHLRWEAFSEVFQDVIAYSSVIAAFDRSSLWVEALQILTSMEAGQVPPNDVSFNSAISACAKGGEWQRAVWLLQGMASRDWADAMSRVVEPTQLTIQTIRAGAMEGPKLPTSSGHCCGSGSSAGFCRGQLRRSVISFSAAISACECNLEWQRGIFLLQMMLESACAPDVIALNASFQNCEMARQWEMALALLRQGLQWHLEPDVMSWTMVLGACAKTRRWELTLSLLVSMLGQRLEPSIISFNTVLSAMDQLASRPFTWEDAQIADPYVHLTNRTVQRHDAPEEKASDEDEAHIMMLPAFLKWAEEH